MRARQSMLVFLATGVVLSATAVPALAQTPGVREVSASARNVITLQTRIRYTTMIVLPEGEEILDVICGDKDFWLISATHNLAHVKPAKEGAATNLNLVTASGMVYSFLLNERGDVHEIGSSAQSSKTLVQRRRLVRLTPREAWCRRAP